MSFGYSVRVVPPRPYGLDWGWLGCLIRWKRGLRRMGGAYPESWTACVKQNRQQPKKGTRQPCRKSTTSAWTRTRNLSPSPRKEARFAFTARPAAPGAGAAAEMSRLRETHVPARDAGAGTDVKRDESKCAVRSRDEMSARRVAGGVRTGGEKTRSRTGFQRGR